MQNAHIGMLRRQCVRDVPGAVGTGIVDDENRGTGNGIQCPTHQRNEIGGLVVRGDAHQDVRVGDGHRANTFGVQIR